MDKLPPYSEEAEKAVVGCCLTDPAACIPETALTLTSPTFFYDIRCQAAWREMTSMHPCEVNIITLAARMKTESTAAHLFLSECQDAAFSTANLSSWLEMISEKFILRQLIKLGTETAQAAYSTTDVSGLLDGFEAAALKIRPSRRERKDMKSLVADAIEIIDRRSTDWEKITGLSTGINDLDQKTDGLHQGELIVCAAYPSCGKTALAVNICVHNSLAGVPVGIISAEMRPVQLVIRSICSESRVNFRKIDENSYARMIPFAGALSRAPVEIEQANGWTIGQVVAAARRMKQTAGIQLLAVDYMQRLVGTGDNRSQQIASIGAGLKNVAMELEIPVIALSQLNDDGKIKESRGPSEDGDSVWKLENDGAWQPDIQPVILRVEKCRDGETGAVPLTFLKTITRFEQASKFTDEESRSPHNSDL